MFKVSDNRILRFMIILVIWLVISGCTPQPKSDFENKFPRPQWWDTVSVNKKINSYDELQSLWESKIDSKKFIKAAFSTTIEHPGDADILMTTINLFPHCDPSYPHLVSLFEYALDKHLNYRDRRRGAWPADTVAGITSSLAGRYIDKKEYDKATLVIDRLLSKRKAEVNGNLRGGLSSLKAQALFLKGNETEAMQVLEMAIADYHGDWKENLQKELAEYKEILNQREKSQSKPVISSVPFNTSCEEFLKRKEITDVRECGITEAGAFGTVAGHTYYNVIYCIIPSSSEPGKCGDDSFPAHYYRERGLGIYMQEESGKQAKLFLERGDPDIGLYVYEKPVIINNRFGTFMHVPIRLDGTGNGNESEYYIWDNKSKTWKKLDTRSWESELSKKVPAGLTINKGIWPDIEAMTAEVGLYRKKDANCCPTGGTAIVKLTLKDSQLRMQSVEFRKYQEQ